MKSLFFVIALLMSNISIATPKIETIQLNHRLATELLAEIRDFLPEGVPVRAFNNFIIIKAESDVINDIKQLIHKLDTPLQRLKVSILRTDKRLSEQQLSQTSADILIDGNDVSGRLSIKQWSTRDAKNKDQYYQAQGIAGKRILIMMGQAIPQKEQFLAILSHGGVAIQSSTRYINIDNGFQAIARILPNYQVHIDIHPVFGQFSKQNGTIEQSEIISTLSGSVGNWLELGQINNLKNTEKQGATRYHSRHQLQQFVYIKIDEVD
ncbi:MAG: hypothetical protein HRT92_04615 [Piscirickettsiaceae bacterium]|nr:hypothetical protein [Piscirickettsiaceae bacterium]